MTMFETNFEVSAAERARWEPHARALLAFQRGDSEATMLVIDDLGDVEPLPASWFFRDEDELPPLERQALDLCQGSVLDLGAGAGCHSLLLQQRGHPVCAVEIFPELVELLRRRGVSDARPGSVLGAPAGPWDTVLMLMNGWGLTATLPGLDRFLAEADRLVSPGGRIIADSTDMRRFAAAWRLEHGSRQAVREDGRYAGEVHFQLEFAGKRGAPFSYLYVDPETLSSRAARAGWDVEIVGRGENEAFLSVLRRSGGREGTGVPSEHCKREDDEHDGHTRWRREATRGASDRDPRPVAGGLAPDVQDDGEVAS